MKHKWTALWLTLALFCTLLAGCEALQPPSQSQGTAPSPGETLTVHFIDVGQADAALLLCGGETMLIDGGNAEDSSLLVSYLEDLGWSTWTMWCVPTPTRTMWAASPAP